MRRAQKMSDKPDNDGKILVQVRMPPEDVRKLDALKKVLDRESRSNMAAVAVRDWMRRQMADPEIAAQVEAELKVRT
jgi:hypothetical protein